jgi:addiction module HigA family antidote
MSKNGMRPVHPGEILREDYLAELGMSANALAKALAVPAPRVNDIVRERRGVTADTALRLARYFDTTPQFWLNLQSAYDLRLAEIAAGARVKREVPVMAKTT